MSSLLVPRQAAGGGGGGGTQQGSARSSGPSSATALLWTIVPSVLLAAGLLLVFVVLRKKLRHIYLARTYLAVFRERQRIAWSGLGAFFKTKDVVALHHHGLDAYFFLRFWWFSFFICLVAIPVTWSVLMPVYGTGNGGQEQLDVISFSNLSTDDDYNRLYAVTFISCGLMLFFMCAIFRERLYALKVTFAYESTPLISTMLSSRTVLLTNVNDDQDCPEEEKTLRKHMWPAAGGKELQDLVDDQTKIVNKLEGAVIKWMQASSKDGNSSSRDVESAKFDPEQRPTSRFVSLKMIGRKVDVIDWCRQRLTEINQDLESKQHEYATMEARNAPAQFIEFRSKAAAYNAYQSRTKMTGKGSEGRTVGTGPNEIIWKNLDVSKKQRKARMALAVAAICLMTIFWGPFTAVIGAISNISYLTNLVPFLSFINDIPSVFLGVITGFLPALLLSLLLVLVPFIIRFMFKFAGCITTSELELKVQQWYFVFQVIQVFIVTTLASGAAAVATTIVQNPPAAVNILAKNLPKASNFYISYLILQGLAFAPKTILNIGPLLMFFVGKVIDKTPRKKLNRYTKVRNIMFGTYLPKFENFVVIAIVYSCIAPLILIFALGAFGLLWLAFRYVLLFSSDTVVINTHGQAYARSLQHVTTGIYLAELCLIGLMAITTSSQGAAAGPLVLNILLLATTIILHVIFNLTVKSLETQAAELASAYHPKISSHNDSEDGEHENETSVSFSRALQRVFAGTDDSESTRTQKKGKFTHKLSRFFLKFLFVPAVPPFPSFFSHPAEKLSEEEYCDAYTHPAALNSPPLLWIAKPRREEARNREQLSELEGLVQINDDEAWLGDDKKRKVQVGWQEAQSDGQEREAIRKTPLWDDIRHY